MGVPQLTGEEAADVLLKALGIEDEKMFRLRVMEALGLILLLLHERGGLLKWLLWTRAVRFDESKPSQLANWERLIGSAGRKEERLWEVVPPRALLGTLRHLRREGTMDKGVETLAEADGHGRFTKEMADDDALVTLIRRQMTKLSKG